MARHLWSATSVVLLPLAASAAVIDFSGVDVSSPSVRTYPGPGGGVYYNGSDLAGGFSADGAFFDNRFTDWGGGFTSWNGWSWSTTADTATPGLANEFSAWVGTPLGRPHGVAYGNGASLRLPAGLDTPLSARIANTTYTALALRDGDAFSRKFGGADGTLPDVFGVDFIGRDSLGSVVGTQRVVLADYRAEDSSGDWILGDWLVVDLSLLGSGIVSLELAFFSTDSGIFGVNTPTYLALDSLSAVPEPAAAASLIGLGAWLLTLRRKLRS
jgi:hypothetical protein